jgi:hypothetical protein
VWTDGGPVPDGQPTFEIALSVSGEAEAAGTS